jgi:CBS domain-containing membrane protein
VDPYPYEGGGSPDAYSGILVAEQGYHGLRKWLVERLGVRGGEVLYNFLGCLLALTVSGLAAYFLKEPLLFPSLGPTAFLFFEYPLASGSSPRNTLIGHLVAVLTGALTLVSFGLLDHPSVLQEGMTLMRIGAAALSMALTGTVLLLLRASHPPAGASVLIVSLGFFHRPIDMLMLMVGVVVLTVVGWVINRAVGVPVPVWSAD